MLEIIGIIGLMFVVMVVFLFKGGLDTGRSGGHIGTVEPLERLREEHSERKISEEEVDEKLQRKREVAQRLDEIASEKDGLMRFDKNGDGVLESSEIAAARIQIGLELAAQRGDIPEARGVASPAEAVEDVDESGEYDPNIKW